MPSEYEMWKNFLIPLILLIGLACAGGLAVVWIVDDLVAKYISKGK